MNMTQGKGNIRLTLLNVNVIRRLYTVGVDDVVGAQTNGVV